MQFECVNQFTLKMNAITGRLFTVFRKLWIAGILHNPPLRARRVLIITFTSTYYIPPDAGFGRQTGRVGPLSRPGPLCFSRVLRFLPNLAASQNYLLWLIVTPCNYLSLSLCSQKVTECAESACFTCYASKSAEYAHLHINLPFPPGVLTHERAGH